MPTLIALGFVGWFSWMFIQHQLNIARELGRFQSEPIDLVGQVRQQFNVFLAQVGGRKQAREKMRYQMAKADKDMARKLQQAGLESVVEQGRYFLLRIVSFTAGPILGASTYLVLPPYYATLSTLALSAAGILIPIFWLSGRIRRRTEDIQRELPLFLDLTTLGTTAGWDLAAAVEKVIDALYAEFPEHPLFKELRRARWLTSSGYTWTEVLDRVGRKLDNDSVRRATLALTQAMKQGGDRSSQLEGIAQDAQRAYYAGLDKRLAGLPVKIVLLTMVLMMSYFLILLAPAVVQVKRTVFGG